MRSIRRKSNIFYALIASNTPANRRRSGLYYRGGLSAGRFRARQAMDVRQPLIHEFLPCALHVDVHEHAVGGLALTAVARHCIGVVEMRLLAHLKCEGGA